MDAEALIAEGVRRERERVVFRLRWEADSMSPIIAQILRKLAGEIERGDVVPA